MRSLGDSNSRFLRTPFSPYHEEFDGFFQPESLKEWLAAKIQAQRLSEEPKRFQYLKPADNWLETAARNSPEHLEPWRSYLLETALTGHKNTWPTLRSLTEHLDGKIETIRTGLVSTTAKVRQSAALWAKSFPEGSLLEDVSAALAREKSKPTAVILRDALVACGGNVEATLSMPDVQQLASTHKYPAKALAWLDTSSLPALKWNELPGVVDSNLVEWMVGTSVASKSAEPVAMLREVISWITPASMDAFAEELMAQWMSGDLYLGTADQIEERIKVRVHSYFADRDGHLSQADYDRYEPSIRAMLDGKPIASQIRSVGVLAIGAMAGGKPVVEMARSYLRYHHDRTAQAKKLLTMLSYRSDPQSISLLVDVSRKYKSTPVKKHAAVCLLEAGSRLGLNADELSDRTVTAAGFNKVRERTLGGDSESYKAILQDDLTLKVLNSAGREVKSIKAEPARKELASVKREVKKASKDLRVRYQNALWVGTSWAPDVWAEFVYSHPVVGTIARRMLWQEVREDERLPSDKI